MRGDVEGKTLHGLRLRARENHAAAKLLLGEGQYNAAATRAYYALYQAIVAELEDKGRRPDEFYSPSERDKEAVKWPHVTVIRISRAAAGLEPEEQSVVRLAWEQRLQADYKPEPVQREDIEYLMGRLDGVLDSLGAL